MNSRLQVPAWPVYRLTEGPDGIVTVTGPALAPHPYPEPAAAVSAVARLAAELGRPVRAEATDPDGTTWTLIVSPDGTTTETGSSQQAKGSPRRARKRETRRRPSPPAAVDPPAPTAAPTLEVPAENHPAAELAESPSPYRAPESQPMASPFETIKAYAEAGDIDRAAQLAAALDDATMNRHGPSHPATLQAREVRAHIAAERGQLAEAVILYRDVAERWWHQGEHAQAETTASRAHALWLRITDHDQAVHAGLAVVRMRSQIPGPGARAYAAAQQHQAELEAAHADHTPVP